MHSTTSMQDAVQEPKEVEAAVGAAEPAAGQAAMHNTTSMEDAVQEPKGAGAAAGAAEPAAALQALQLLVGQELAERIQRVSKYQGGSIQSLVTRLVVATLWHWEPF
jgi:3-oxoacyl-ACP reductase-like protein